LKKKAQGGAQMFVLCMLIMIFIVVLFRVLFDYQRVHITYYSVEDALTTSLISSCVYNRDEQSLSGATVIYRTVTAASKPNELLADLTGLPVYDSTPFDAVNSSELTNLMADPYLDGCYDRFLKNLKQNLKLDDSMNAIISGIDGTVSIDEFCIYNKFVNLNADGTPGDFRIVKYTRVSDGVWVAFPYNVNQTATCYNSLDHTDYTVTETSVSAKLSFSVVAGTNANWNTAPGAITNITAPVTYQRIVDITKQVP
jgi:hypothetical protein